MAVANGRIKTLIIKHLQEGLTPDEYGELQDWMSFSEENRALFHQLTDSDQLREELKEFHEGRANVWEKIEARTREAAAIKAAEEAKWITRPAFVASRSYKRIWAYAAAACLLLLLVGGYLWLGRGSKSGMALVSKPALKNDIRPGGNKAILILGNGSRILLDTAANGSLAREGSTRISKENGRLAYSASKTGKALETAYNTLTTPKAGQFMVLLPDNTKVWLNNASSLRYPTSFTAAKKRIVELSGEAYFEVAKDPSRPFRVKVNDLAVDVLGTSFNVMAYADEAAVKTTLLEGAVKINKGDQSVLLKPGQQAQFDRGRIHVLRDANTEEAIAWKNGLFEFNSADIETVMRSIGRWYDVEIRYEGEMTSARLTAKVSRDSNASDVLQILSATGYHFRIEGKTIIVLP